MRNGNRPSVVALTGGSGFVGRHVLAELARIPGAKVQALVHSSTPEWPRNTANITWCRGDLEEGDTFDRLLTGTDVCVHLAYPNRWTPAQHVLAAERMGGAVARLGVQRLVHCSTAVVVGKTKAHRVTEATPCEPVTVYERSKMAIEQVLAHTAAGRFELAVLRPTAVFGPAGRNLVKLACDLTGGPRLVNLLRSSLYGARRMNLVCIENVVSAIRFLIDRAQSAPVETYIVSDDDDPANNFRDVERRLMQELGIRTLPLSGVHVPHVALRLALRAAGQVSTDPRRVYDGSLLVQTGFAKRATLAEGLTRFAEWFRNRR